MLHVFSYHCIHFSIYLCQYLISKAMSKYGSINMFINKITYIYIYIHIDIL